MGEPNLSNNGRTKPGRLMVAIFGIVTFMKRFLGFVFIVSCVLCGGVLALGLALGIFIRYDWERWSKQPLPEARAFVDQNAGLIEKVSVFVAQNKVNAIMKSDTGSGFLVNYLARYSDDVPRLEGLTDDENRKLSLLFYDGELWTIWNKADGKLCEFGFGHERFSVAKVVRWKGPPIGRQYYMKVPWEHYRGFLLLTRCARGICDVESAPSNFSKYEEPDDTKWWSWIFSWGK